MALTKQIEAAKGRHPLDRLVQDLEVGPAVVMNHMHHGLRIAGDRERMRSRAEEGSHFVRYAPHDVHHPPAAHRAWSDAH